MPGRRASYHVAPRYTPGSPALVDEKTAMGVADDEKKCYERLIDPSYAGFEPQEESRAKTLGLDGIVEARSEYHDGWKVLDVLTGKQFWRGEQKCYHLLRDDKIVRIDTYNVTYISMTGISITLPRVIERIEMRGAHGVIYLVTPGDGEKDRIACNKAALFQIEREEKQP